MAIKFIRPLVGMLAPREIVTRALPALPEGFLPLVRARSQSKIVVRQQTKESLTIENLGPRSSVYAIVFINQTMIEKASAASQLFDAAIRLAKR